MTFSNSLPADSPVFIFPVRFHLAQEAEILNSWSNFLAQWSSHQALVKAEVKLEEGCFMIVFVDPQLTIPSGCSKDKLHRFAESLADTYGLAPLDPGKFWLKTENGVQAFSRNELKKAWSEGLVGSHNPLFPTWITKLSEYKEWWGKPLDRFFDWARLTSVS